MIWPLLISVPHGGQDIPPEVAELNLLSRSQIIRDGDEGAAEIYAFAEDAVGFVAARVARAYVDLNRAEDDRRRDGVVKTHTIWEEAIYREPLTSAIAEQLLTRYYWPYHRRLSELAARAKMGIDCHTMAAIGPPDGPLAGEERPYLCLSNGAGTCPDHWLFGLTDCLKKEFEVPVAINDPFQGGYIIRAHAQELPWVQVELSRSSWLSVQEKRCKIHAALTAWCREMSGVF
jgi:formiminoglutamase